MYEEDRPDPDKLLQAVRSEDKSNGKLKIFLGMAAGVGKTFAMLEAAQKLKQDDVNVIVGVINTHGRQETAALLEGLTIIPEKKIVYKDIPFEEFDIDEVLKIKPQVVLVDEFAHTNIPGSRHAKRWQDVMELLDNGIDVYTTLNVQHIESLKDVIENITAIKIRETVPDSIIEKADSIELIDITPEELLKRLKEGKVYLGEKSELAAENFFQQDSITALREIVLRYAAEKVDHDLQEMTSTVSRPDRWKPRERLLIAISHSPHSQKLIRTGRRIAANYHAPWVVVHVDDGRVLNDEEKHLLAKNLSLARDLGAEVITTQDPSIVEGIKRIARQKGTTQLILGRTPPSKSLLGFFKKTSLLDVLAQECTNLDIHVVRQEQILTKYRKKLVAVTPEKHGFNYFLVLLWVSAITAAGWFLSPFISYKVIGVFFLIAILVLSLFFKKGPVFVASVLFAFIWDFFFIPPTSIYTFTISKTPRY